jgi:hypothetical protein
VDLRGSVAGRVGRLGFVLFAAALAALVLLRVGRPAQSPTPPTEAFALALAAGLAAVELVLAAWAVGARLAAGPVTACFLWLLAAPGLWLLLGMPALVLAGMPPAASGPLVDLLGPRVAGVLGYGLAGLLFLVVPAGAALSSRGDLRRWRGYVLAVLLWSASVAALALSRAREPRWQALEAGPPPAGAAALVQVPAFPAALPLAAIFAAAAVLVSVRLARRPPR